VPHAIGAGVTLLEPQYVEPGKKGLTYRFWDWNRRYDPQGLPDAVRGKARELHVARSLAVTDWSCVGAGGVERCRAASRVLGAEGLRHTRVLDGPWFGAERLEGEGAREVETLGGFVALTCTQGEATVSSEAGELRLARGYSAVVPASAGGVSRRGARVGALGLPGALSGAAPSGADKAGQSGHHVVGRGVGHRRPNDHDQGGGHRRHTQQRLRARRGHRGPWARGGGRGLGRGGIWWGGVRWAARWCRGCGRWGGRASGATTRTIC
jgi:hypothetical protein